MGEAEKPSTVPGARIHCTQDGGKTWNQTFFQPGNNGGGNVTVGGRGGWGVCVCVKHGALGGRPPAFVGDSLACRRIS